jgi:TBC1 domain family protein 5
MENFSKDKRRSIHKVGISRFREIYNQQLDIRDLINTGLDGKINDDVRAIYWKIYLGLIPIDKPSNWVKVLSQERQGYFDKLDSWITNQMERYINDEVEEIIGIDKDDLDTLNLIKLDVRRTYQEIDMFRNKHVKAILVRVLYIWNKQQADISYIQGMNEIIGTLFYALYPVRGCVNDTLVDDEETSVYNFLNSEEGFEADLYSIFNTIMKRGMKDLYNYNDAKGRNQSTTSSEAFDINYSGFTLTDIENNPKHSHLKKRINRIFYYYLKFIDKELFTHICDKVEPYLFLFRWILCLLTRELTNLKNVIYVWDCLLAFEGIESGKLDFLDSMCLSMICSVRDELMAEDDGCYMLQRLMHFPNESSIKDITRQAMIIRELINEHLNQLRCKLYL